MTLRMRVGFIRLIFEEAIVGVIRWHTLRGSGSFQGLVMVESHKPIGIARNILLIDAIDE